MNFEQERETTWEHHANNPAYIVDRGLNPGDFENDSYELQLGYFHGKSVSGTITEKIKSVNGERPIDILDAGCGVGNFLLDCSLQWGNNVSLSGVSAYPYHMLDDSHALALRRRGIDISVENIEKYDKEERFDLITSMYMMGYVFDPVATLTRLYAALRPGGIAYLYPFSILTETSDDEKSFDQYLETKYQFSIANRHVAFEKRHQSLSVPVEITGTKTRFIFISGQQAVYRFVK